MGFPNVGGVAERPCPKCVKTSTTSGKRSLIRVSFKRLNVAEVSKSTREYKIT